MSPELLQAIENNKESLYDHKLKDFYATLEGLDDKLDLAIPVREEFTHYVVANDLDYELLQALEFVPEECYSECERGTIQIPANVNMVEAFAFESYEGDIYFQGDAVSLKLLSMVDIDSQCKIHTKPGFTIIGSGPDISEFRTHQMEDL